MNAPAPSPAPRDEQTLARALARRVPPRSHLRVLELVGPAPGDATPVDRYLDAGAAVTRLRIGADEAAPGSRRWRPFHRDAALAPGESLARAGVGPGSHELILWRAPGRPDVLALRTALTPGGALAVVGADAVAALLEADLEDMFTLPGRDAALARAPGDATPLPVELRALDRAACVDRARVRAVFERPPTRGCPAINVTSSAAFAAARARMLASARAGLEPGSELDPHALALPSCAPPLPAATPACDVLAVLPHPDDESIYAGGTLARLVALGLRVELVTLTGGEGGRAADAVRSPPELATIRAREWTAALRHLGITGASALRFADFGKYRDAHKAAPVTCADTLRRWQLDALLRALIEVIREHRPRALLSTAPDRDPNYSLHGHHLACGVGVALAFHLAGDPETSSARAPWAAGVHRVLAPSHVSGALAIELTEDARARKRAAIAAHESQRYSTARLLAALDAGAPEAAREHLDLLQARAGAPDPFLALAPGERDCTRGEQRS